MKTIFLIGVPFLLSIIGISGTDLVIDQRNEEPQTYDTFEFDDHQFKDLSHQVQHVKDATDKMFLKFELITFSIKEELTAMKTSIIQEIGELIATQINSLSNNMKNETDDLSKFLATSVKSEISDLKKSLLANVTSELFKNCGKGDIKNAIQLQINEKEIKNSRDAPSNGEEAIQPQTNNTAISSQSIESTANAFFANVSEKSQSTTNDFIANVTEKSPLDPRMYASCTEALENGGKSGVYKLNLSFSDLKPFDVYCLSDPKNGTAWTVVQRRQDGSVDFYKNWQEYKEGFGEVSGEYFIGLENLYALTNHAKLQQLWIKLTDWYGKTRSAKYAIFKIGNESSKYNLERLGVFSGDAGDSLSRHRSSKFSTMDSYNVGGTVNCAEKYKGAWWFRYDCHFSHLNGEYLHGDLPNDYRGRGIIWRTFSYNYHYSYKYAHMAIRTSY